jgi:hypothetical protein
MGPIITPTFTPASLSKYINVFKHISILGNQSYRLVKFITHFQQLAGKMVFLFGWLITVGVATETDGQAFPFGMHQEFAEQLRRVDLYYNFSLEVKTGAISPILMRIPGIAVNASMFAAGVGIHAVVHAYIGTVDLVDDAF